MHRSDIKSRLRASLLVSVVLPASFNSELERLTREKMRGKTKCCAANVAPLIRLGKLDDQL